VTSAHSDHLLAVRQASAGTGLDATDARLIHHYSNAIYLLPAEQAVARVTFGREAAEKVNRSLAVTRWLVEQRFPATEPLAGTSPVTADDVVVSFWRYYPQPEGPSPFTSAHLADLLRLLHKTEPPPFQLPPWIPLESLEATVTDPALSAALTDNERAWIVARIGEVRDKIAGLDWPLGSGLIHGDAWAGNLLSCPGARPDGVVLGDWDWVSAGPREVDLIPTWHAAVRYGRSATWVSDFAGRYGYDLARWDGFPVMMAMRDLVQLSGPIRRARESEPHRRVLRQRLDDLRSGDTTSSWHAL
jgi:aminoglycoside phosphotransferase (APT) family kinase protein